MFPGNCFTGYGNVSTSIFKYISHASDMIAKAEPLLFLGQMPQSDVAFLFPRSSFAWDVPEGVSCPGGNESPAGRAMDYAAVLAGKLSLALHVLAMILSLMTHAQRWRARRHVSDAGTARQGWPHHRLYR
eukprot:SAG22_NODE_3023_length_2016_cov_3.499764_2_plen_130_part_00